jgi:transposase-like protein
MRAYHPDVKAKILKLYNDGVAPEILKERFGVDKGTVASWMRAIKKAADKVRVRRK